jgi:cellulose synthase/poly-beta-1,6-N-acetylglucosamine synthase-like glycosyltransferase
MKLKLVFLLISVFLNSLLISQKKINRNEFKNELYLSNYLTHIDLNLYGVGFERTFLNKGNIFYSIQNEFTLSIAPKKGDDGKRIQSLIKWNKEKMTIISFGAGLSYRLNKHPEKLSFIVNNYNTPQNLDSDLNLILYL